MPASSDDRLLHHLESELRVRHLAPAELEAQLHLVAVVEELLGVAQLRVEVVRGDARRELDLLDLARGRLRVGVLLLLLVDVLAEVHDPADGTGVALGATSTRSRPTSSARLTAFGVSRMPSCLPSGEITRTCGTFIRWLRRMLANGSLLRRWYCPFGRLPPGAAGGVGMAINNYAAGCVESGDGRLKPPRIQHLNAEAFAAGAARLRVRVGELEPARDQLGRVIEHGALQVERGPRVDEHRDPGRPDQDVAPLGLRRRT